MSFEDRYWTHQRVKLFPSLPGWLSGYVDRFMFCCPRCKATTEHSLWPSGSIVRRHMLSCPANVRPVPYVPTKEEVWR